MQALINHFRGKTVLILGFGKEGKSCYEFIRKYHRKVKITIADLNDLSIENKKLIENDTFTSVIYGDSYLSNLYKYDIILKSPGVSLKHVNTAVLNQSLSSQTELFLKFFGSRIIGITGTKGKSTTASLVYHILKQSYKKVVLGGNIGIPPLNLLPLDDETLVVLEISSHQLEFCNYSPKIAVLLNVYPEHLNHYKSFNHYKRAKYNIANFQNKLDCFIYNSSQPEILDFVKTLCTGNKIGVNYKQASILQSYKFNLVGNHNLFNVLVAITVCEQLNIGFDEALKHALSFKPLEHRLEFFGKFEDKDFYNDSISTVPQSAISALESIKNSDVFICGGLDRGVNLDELGEYLKNHKDLKSIFIYETGEKLYKNYKEQINCIYVKNISLAVKQAVNLCKAGGAVVFSPAAASYGEFKNFEERGKIFKNLVKSYYKRI